MLLERTRPGAGGRVVVVTRSQKINRLLQAILDEWHFVVNDDSAPADILLMERGLTPPSGDHGVIWLSPLPLGIEPHIELPLSLVELYHYLEQLFFPQPRRHIRLPVDQVVDINLDGSWMTGRLLSVSDRGARVSCPASLSKGAGLQLGFKLDGYPLHVTAEVIYEIPAGDSPGREHPQAGLLFKPLRPSLRQSLRHFIELSFVSRACAKVGVDGGDASLSWFDLVDNPWAELDD